MGDLSNGNFRVCSFFFMLYLLGIDTAFAFMDSCIIVLKDTTFLGGVPSWKVALGVSAVAWLFSFLYATDSGLIFLDIFDYTINMAMLLVGAFK